MAACVGVGFIVGMLYLVSLLSAAVTLPTAPAVPPVVPAGNSFTCTAERVWDGDGPIWCREGPRIRLANLATREIDGSCRPGHPCPAASGIEARDHLVKLLGGAIGTARSGHILIRPVPLACRSRGWGKGRRTDSACSIDGRDLSAAMIADGYGAEWKYR